MKYNVRYYENQNWNSEICGSKEETVAFVQKLRLERNVLPQWIRISPHIEPNTIVFNKKNYETRLVGIVDEKRGIIKVYDTDKIDALDDLITRHTLKIREIWQMEDCIPVDAEKLKKSGFEFGSSMGHLSEALSIYHKWGVFE